ncbi:hypothetical protein BC829DRAFT_390397 [Chytridium lagenaria]|nr:hypothetical protein BC829DRAFT_390397 [Chytridium lagenaria]
MKNSITKQLLVLLLLVISTFANTSPPMTLTAEALTLGQQFQTLRTIKGHFEGGEYNADVDGFNGIKHKTMEKLREILGVKGTPAKNVITALGKPDATLSAAEAGIDTMPGPVLDSPPASSPQKGLYMIYKWRGNHDYLRFLIDDEQVVLADWYQALE